MTRGPAPAWMRDPSFVRRVLRLYESERPDGKRRSLRDISWVLAREGVLGRTGKPLTASTLRLIIAHGREHHAELYPPGLSWKEERGTDQIPDKRRKGPWNPKMGKALQTDVQALKRIKAGRSRRT